MVSRIQPLRVLCAGREELPAVQAELRKGGYQIVCEHVSTVEELESALARPWDLAFAGARGDLAGLAVLAAAHRKGVDLPLIVVSGRIKDSEVVALFKAGAVNHFTPRTL